jgi:hypothetical protein
MNSCTQKLEIETCCLSVQIHEPESTLSKFLEEVIHVMGS